MKKLLAALVVALGLALGFGFNPQGWAQTYTAAVQLSQDLRGPFLTDANYGLYLPQHLLSIQTAKPVLGACITGGSPLLTGTDFEGSITAGSSASTSCTVTFAKAYGVAPNCVVTWASGPLAAMSWTTSTTVLTITQTSNASSVINYICSGAQ